jgi:hypothetical protein
MDEALSATHGGFALMLGPGRDYPKQPSTWVPPLVGDAHRLSLRQMARKSYGHRVAIDRDEFTRDIYAHRILHLIESEVAEKTLRPFRAQASSLADYIIASIHGKKTQQELVEEQKETEVYEQEGAKGADEHHGPVSPAP